MRSSRRPCRMPVVAGVIGQVLGFARAVGVRHIYLAVAIPDRVEQNLRAIGRPCGAEIARWVLGKVGRPYPGEVAHLRGRQAHDVYLLGWT